MNRLRVAVIGGGASGLCAARYLAARPDRYEPVVFEKTDRIGGTWVYTDSTGKDKYGQPIHSSMYSSLKSNIPKEVMAFPDLPFDDKLPSYIRHRDTLDYLDRYANHFDLSKYIKFCNIVESARPVKSTGNEQQVTWEIKTRDVETRVAKSVTSIHDAVIVCNGHFSVPKLPSISGLDTFPGEVFHSHNYRRPSVFQGKSVLIIGANQSGIDIALDIAPHAKHVYLSHWKERLTTPLPENITESQALKSLDKSEVTFTDGATVKVDAILYCTGYNYTYPFLHEDCMVNVDDGRVTPLFKHVIHTRFPSLSFIGVTSIMSPFLQFSAQVQFALAALSGAMNLPSSEEMEADQEREYRGRLAEGMPHRKAHFMGTKQWDYNAELLRMAGEPQHKPVMQKLYDDVTEFRNTDACNYKNMNFKIIDNESYEILP